jgi:hypothetical protein
MTYDRLIEMDKSFDNDIGLVLVLLSVTAHECAVRTDEVRAELAIPAGHQERGQGR